MESNFEKFSSSQLFKNVGLRVVKNDRNATTIIDICFDKISNFKYFHELCAATTIQIKTSLILHIDTDETSASTVDELNHEHRVNRRSPITPIEELSSAGIDRTSTPKRKHTDMNGSDLETNKRKAKRANVPCEGQSVPPFSYPTLQSHDVPERTANRNNQFSIFASNSRTNNRNDNQKKEQQPTGTNEANMAANRTQAGEFSVDLGTNEQFPTTRSTISSVELDLSSMLVKQNVTECTGIVASSTQCAEDEQDHPDDIEKKEKTANNCGAAQQISETISESSGWQDCSSWIDHVTTYHSDSIEKTYCCHLCEQTCGRKIDLQKHINLAHCGVRFMCPIRRCSSKFDRKFLLKNHLVNKHDKGIIGIVIGGKDQ